MSIDMHGITTSPPITRDSEEYTVAKLDIDDYREDLANFELTPEQEIELLSTLWQIMATMVDIGWGVDNVQLMIPDLFNRESAIVKEHTIENDIGKDGVDAGS
ncbi:hypothetical protein QSV34_10640 [Porticoccus sp. W117]|uniref:hypothetical protein n=1 Tax=Porticoccus sp. W117 TaxID=3054777 RepID=UPI002594E57B|nr:hypothetical protein [Porticoccus sp. W117]MDM3871808.1 hypothetical protein [Porticoccus sp. W117]